MFLYLLSLFVTSWITWVEWCWLGFERHPLESPFWFEELRCESGVNLIGLRTPPFRHRLGTDHHYIDWRWSIFYSQSQWLYSQYPCGRPKKLWRLKPALGPSKTLWNWLDFQLPGKPMDWAANPARSESRLWGCTSTYKFAEFDKDEIVWASKDLCRPSDSRNILPQMPLQHVSFFGDKIKVAS